MPGATIETLREAIHDLQRSATDNGEAIAKIDGRFEQYLESQARICKECHDLVALIANTQRGEHGVLGRVSVLEETSKRAVTAIAQLGVDGVEIGKRVTVLETDAKGRRRDERLILGAIVTVAVALMNWTPHLLGWWK